MLGLTVPPGMPAWSAGVLLALVVSAAVTDARLGKIPNWLTYPAILIGLAGNTWTGGIGLEAGQMGLAGSAAGFAVGFLPLLLCWLAGGIGGGDAKLMGAIGAIGGWEFVLSAMLYGFLVAAVMAAIVMVRRRLVRRTLRRVWHTIVLLVVPGARPVDPTSSDSPTVPFAVGLCIGTAGAILEVMLRAWAAGS